MAARENQGLQIALMISVFFCVLLAVFTYLFYSWYSDQAKATNDARARQNEASQRAQVAEDQNRELKTMMGFAEETTQDEVRNQFAKDMEKYGKNYGENPRYHTVLDSMFNELGDAVARESELTKSKQELDDKYAKLESDNRKQEEAFKSKMDQFETDLHDERDEFNKQRGDTKRMADQLADDKQKIQEKLTQTVAENRAKADEDAKRIGELEAINEKNIVEIRGLTDENFEVPDGQIVKVSQRDRTVWIDIGKRDGLRPKTTFKVYAADETDAHVAESKASIEVTRLLDNGRLAEATITHDELDNLILPGDKVYTPLWNRGRQEHFALVGFIDIDGDGISDRQRVGELIEASGGVVDAQMLEDGKVEGKMSVDTRFLVRGDEPDIGTTDIPVSVTVIANGINEMTNQAQSLGVTPISVEKFLDHIGWKDERRTVKLGRGAVARDFPPRAAEGQGARRSDTTSSGFRKRRPTRLPY